MYECTPLVPLSSADMHRAGSMYCLPVSSVTAKQADFLKSAEESMGADPFPVWKRAVLLWNAWKARSLLSCMPPQAPLPQGHAITEVFKLEGSPGQQLIQTLASVVSGLSGS